MRPIQQHRVGRPTKVILVAGVALTCGLAGCSQAATPPAQGTKLSAAQGSDVVAPPSERIYEVTNIELSAAEPALGLTLPESVTPTGYFIVGDGVITDARFVAEFGGDDSQQATASFELTAPTVLRRVQSDDASLTAVGTVTLGGVERPNTDVEFSVLSLDDRGAELEVLMNTPASLLEAHNTGTTVVARLTFDVQ